MLLGYNSASQVEYTITNNHTGTVNLTLIGLGAYLNNSLWQLILAQITALASSLFPL